MARMMKSDPSLVEPYLRESWNMFQDTVAQKKAAAIVIDESESLRFLKNQDGFWYSLAVSSSNVGGFKVFAFMSDGDYGQQIPRCKCYRLVWNSKASSWTRKFVVSHGHTDVLV